MSKLTEAPLVLSKPTNFFTKLKPNSLENNNFKHNAPLFSEHKPKEIKRKGRPIVERVNKKEIKLSISLPSKLNNDLEEGLSYYNESKQGDVFFKPISKNEFIGKLLQTSEELNKLLQIKKVDKK